MTAQHHVVEDFNGSVHAKRTLLQVVIDNSLLRRQVARLDEHLLELEQIELDVLALLKELILIVRLLNLRVLLTDVPNCSLHFLLHIFDFFCCIYQLQSSFEHLLVLFAAFAVFELLLHLLSLGFLVLDQSVHVLAELLIAIEALINVVSGLEVFQTAELRLFKSNLRSIDVVLIRSLIEHRLDFIEPQGHDFIVFVANLSQIARNFRQVVGTEEYVWVGIETEFDVFGHFVQAPALVHFTERVVVVFDRVVA